MRDRANPAAGPPPPGAPDPPGLGAPETHSREESAAAPNKTRPQGPGLPRDDDDTSPGAEALAYPVPKPGPAGLLDLEARGGPRALAPVHGGPSQHGNGTESTPRVGLAPGVRLNRRTQSQYHAGGHNKIWTQDQTTDMARIGHGERAGEGRRALCPSKTRPVAPPPIRAAGRRTGAEIINRFDSPSHHSPVTPAARWPLSKGEADGYGTRTHTYVLQTYTGGTSRQAKSPCSAPVEAARVPSNVCLSPSLPAPARLSPPLSLPVKGAESRGCLGPGIWGPHTLSRLTGNRHCDPRARDLASIESQTRPPFCLSSRTSALPFGLRIPPLPSTSSSVHPTSAVRDAVASFRPGDWLGHDAPDALLAFVMNADVQAQLTGTKNIDAIGRNASTPGPSLRAPPLSLDAALSATLRARQNHAGPVRVEPRGDPGLVRVHRRD
ncbi:hypothetical protein CDD83_4067 [Cordyceps sp. RAO-2017]|nr:hypothetical protein CDD83_4067 [Cordyceps sp. RAO-2017]